MQGEDEKSHHGVEAACVFCDVQLSYCFGELTGVIADGELIEISLKIVGNELLESHGALVDQGGANIFGADRVVEVFAGV